jgi:hypothetical protein
VDRGAGRGASAVGRLCAPRVTITSFNEWGEGTQIEPAVPRNVDVGALAPIGGALPRELRAALRLSDVYEDYEDAGGPTAYLEATRRFAAELRRSGEEGRDVEPAGQQHGTEL